MASKKYLIYYLDFILAIQFLISHWPFVLYLVYAPVWHYSTDNPENPQLDNKNKQIYREMHIIDWW